MKKWDENSDVDLKESIHFEDIQNFNNQKGPINNNEK